MELYGLALRPDGFIYRGRADLDTERSLATEVTLTAAHGAVVASVTGFDNRVTDMVVPANVTDSVSGRPVREYQNLGEARIRGLSATVQSELPAAFQVEARATWTHGEDPKSDAPLPSIPPLGGGLALRRDFGAAVRWAEAEWQGAYRQRRVAASVGEVQTPGWGAFNLRAGAALAGSEVTLGVDNLFDHLYRGHLDPYTLYRPGRNFFVRVSRRLLSPGLARPLSGPNVPWSVAQRPRFVPRVDGKRPAGGPSGWPASCVSTALGETPDFDPTTVRIERGSRGDQRMRTRRALLLGVAISLMGIGPQSIVAQDPGRMAQQQQQLHMQQMQQQLHQSMERMAGIQQRAQTMEREMAQLMERIHQNPDLIARNAEQLRNQERLHSMAQATNDGAREMHRAMEQLRNMMGEPGAGDQEMQRDMARLRQHWDEMAGQMEEGLQIMERLQDRLQLQEHR